MLRMHCVQLFHDLSDPGTEDMHATKRPLQDWIYTIYTVGHRP